MAGPGTRLIDVSFDATRTTKTFFKDIIYENSSSCLTSVALWPVLAALVVAIPLLVGASRLYKGLGGAATGGRVSDPARAAGRSSIPTQAFEPRWPKADTSGFAYFPKIVQQWKPDASLEEISKVWHRLGYREVEFIDGELAKADRKKGEHISLMFVKATFLNCEGEAEKAYQVLEELRSIVASDDKFAVHAMGNVFFFQGVTALRRGENDNCIMCRGESSCILPISPAAVHTNPTGSRLAIKHFTEYLEQYPDDLEVEYLLNIAHMTLGEYPDKVDPRYRLNLDHFFHSEFNIGKFRDVGHLRESTAIIRPAARSWRILTTTVCSTWSSAHSTPLSPCPITATRGIPPSRTAARRLE